MIWIDKSKAPQHWRDAEAIAPARLNVNGYAERQCPVCKKFVAEGQQGFRGVNFLKHHGRYVKKKPAAQKGAAA